MKRTLPRVDVNRHELDKILERVRETLSEEDYQKLKAALETLAYLTELVEDRQTTIHRLRQILFGASTEKTRQVIQTPPEEGQAPAGSAEPNSGGREGSEKQRKGHGRNGARTYVGATKIQVSHASLKSGDRCPECRKGKVYSLKVPAFLVRIVGQAPLGATVYELENLRCNLCLEVFTADAPEGVGPDKYDARSAGMIALLKYGSGFPFYRLERLQASLGIPLPASTQWEIVEETAAGLEPAYQELIRQAAQGEVLHNDDTSVKILALMRGHENAPPPEEESERTGIFTSGIVSTRDRHQIALFFTGRKHAGENLATVLAQRASELGPPIQMCDALSRNPPKEFEVILAHCVAHGRRQFVDVARTFPDECRYVLETLAQVYRNEERAREQALSPQERLALHQEQSGPLMEKLRQWFEEQFAERKVEPNSGLGKAISYFQNHWIKLTRFLQVRGAPLDNNVCERALKKVILHRKNALFFKTENGAHVSDVFMSLIYSCQLCGADPFHYLTELQKHGVEMTKTPQEWMPWNYREALQRSSPSPRAPADRASPQTLD